MRLIFSSDAMLSSIFFVTCVSTSSGDAPGYTVLMINSGTSNRGNNSYGILLYDTSPKRTRIKKITAMSFGFLTDSSVILIFSLIAIYQPVFTFLLAAKHSSYFNRCTVFQIAHSYCDDLVPITNTINNLNIISYDHACDNLSQNCS